MTDFFNAVLTYQFMQYAILAGFLVSLSCGIVGTYIVVRRITYIAGGIAHCVLGGMGAARYFQTVHGWTGFHPIHGAVIAAILAAVIIAFVSLRARQREDTVIGAVWSIGMAIGVLFIAKTPGYNEDLMSYLFGNILMVTPQDLRLIGLLDLVVLGAGILFYNQFQAICFDEEFARLRGINVEFYYLLLLCLTALTVVLVITVVGIVMVIALLTLPVAIAGRFSQSLWQMMILSFLFSSLFTITGLALSYQPDLPAGAMIIMVSGMVYLVVACSGSLKKIWKIRFSRNSGDQ